MNTKTIVEMAQGDSPLYIASSDVRPTLITGGAGFIGANLAYRLLQAGEPVLILDNLARPNVIRNIEWLRRRHEGMVTLKIADVRDARAVAQAVKQSSFVFHLAAQVAVTTSLSDPVLDFDVNARGTLNVLEAIRAAERPPGMLFASTNKVYGALEDIALEEDGDRFEPKNAVIRAAGVPESRPLDFHSPYGCSKGTADQYVIDYARSYGLAAAVFRMSSIYGPHQFGNEDQGWVAHFMFRAARGEPITVYGDGHQVRDVLYIDDLIDAFILARHRLDRLSGAAFNIGGGPRSTLSLRELLARIEQIEGRCPALDWGATRIGDQRYYVSDTRRFSQLTGWAPRVGIEDGLMRLHAWVRESAGESTYAPRMVEAAE